MDLEEVDSQKVKIWLVQESFNEPALFEGFIDHWGARKWSAQFFAEHPLLSKLEVLFRVVDSETPQLKKPRVAGVQWENESKYISWKFEDFLNFINSDNNESSDSFAWAYADYKYMAEIFETTPELMADVDWGSFGFTDRDGRASTFWMGSRGAHTPCHYDTYGCNLVAQLYGKKKWTLFPPSEMDYLYPTRVPFEESTVFSQVDIRNCDTNKFPLFTKAKRYEITLEPGQVLYVPKHWWHFVECETAAVSVNTWIELESDQHDRRNELLAAMITKSMVDYAGEDNSQSIYNPKEVPMSYADGMPLLNNLKSEPPTKKPVDEDKGRTFRLRCTCCKGSLTTLQPIQTSPPPHDTSDLQKGKVPADPVDLNRLLTCLTHPTVIECISELLHK